MTITGTHRNPESQIRALFSVSNRKHSVQIIRNPDRIVRTDWAWRAHFGKITITRVSL